MSFCWHWVADRAHAETEAALPAEQPAATGWTAVHLTELASAQAP